MTFQKKKLGAKGEEIAGRYLKGRGYRIIERNYRSRLGEIDIIAEQGQDLVFIEVKTRTDILFGTPFESITVQKQKQLAKVALEYLGKEDIQDRPARFDVIGIRLKGVDDTFHEAEIELLQNAFELC
ncbi:YraN family protein [Thermodesulfobacteriota bacterium]